MGEPHLWLGDSLRLSNRDTEAEAAYREYLKLTNFDPKLSGQLNYYVLGSLIGLGGARRLPYRTSGGIFAASLTSGCAIPKSA